MEFITKQVSSLSRVFVDGNCEFYEINKAKALRGERFSYQIAYKSDSRVTSRIEVESELKDAVTIRAVGNVASELPCYPDQKAFCERSEPGLFPDVLYTVGDTHFIKPSGWFSLWVTVEVPEDIKPGDYTITIKVYGEEDGIYSETLTLTVIDAVLPEQTLISTQWFHADCLANYYNVDVWSDRHFEIVENFARTARRNGINMLLTPIFTPPLDTAVGGERRTTQLVGVALNDGKYSFDFSLLDRWVDMLDRCGIEYIEISHLFTQWGAKHAPKIMATVDGEYKKLFGWHTDAHSEEYTTFLQTFLPALINHMKARGDDKRCFFHVSDEPHKGDEDNYKKSKEAVSEILKDYTIMDALSSIEFYNMGIIQHPIPSNNKITPFLEANIPGLWTYYCVSQPINVSNRFHSMPNWRNRSIGMQMYKYNIAGFLQWGYNFYNNQFSGDPINPFYEQSCDYAFQGGDPFSVYPEMDGTALESPRLIVFYDALQDIKAMKLAEKLTSHDEVVEAMENALGQKITFDTCAKSSEAMHRVRESVNTIIKNNI
jgi:hypothetical protein